MPQYPVGLDALFAAFDGSGPDRVPARGRSQDEADTQSAEVVDL